MFREEKATTNFSSSVRCFSVQVDRSDDLERQNRILITRLAQCQVDGDRRRSEATVVNQPVCKVDKAMETVPIGPDSDQCMQGSFAHFVLL